PTQSKRFGERWGDAAALEAALIQGVSRFRDPGRGQGLAGIRRYLARWDGKIAIRSGTARIAIVPKWDDDVPLKDGLPAFPGAQVLIIIPEQGSTKPRYSTSTCTRCYRNRCRAPIRTWSAVQRAATRASHSN